MMAKRNIRLVFSFITGAVLVLALFHLHSLNLEALTSLPLILPYLIGMIFVSVLYVISGAWKWQMISRQWYGEAPDLVFHINQSALTIFWAQFLPLPIATAFQRTAVMKLSQNKTLSEGVAHAAYDLGSDFVIITILIGASCLELFFKIGFSGWLGVGTVGSLVFLGILTQSDLLLRHSATFFAKHRRTKKWAEIITSCRSHGLFQPRFLMTMTGIGIFRFFIVTIRLCLGASAMGLVIPWSAIAFVSPLAVLPSLVPLTPANLGVSEWSWAYLLFIWHIPTATGILFATGFRVLTLAIQGGIAIISFLAYKFASKDYTSS